MPKAYHPFRKERISLQTALPKQCRLLCSVDFVDRSPTGGRKCTGGGRIFDQGGRIFQLGGRIFRTRGCRLRSGSYCKINLCGADDEDGDAE